MLNKRILVLIFLLVFLPLAGCFPSPAPPITENQAPVITSIPVTDVTEGETYVYDVEATDPNGDTLTYSLITQPTGMTINPATGLIKWTPTAKGNYAVVVKVSDGALDIIQGFTIVVSEPSAPPPVNHAPIITSIPNYTNLTTIVGVDYVYEVKATDPDGDVLTYSLTNKPDDMTIVSSTGKITWTPGNTGSYDVTVKVSDGKLSDTQIFTITVREPELELTGIVVDPKAMTLFVEGAEKIVSVTATYEFRGDGVLVPLGDCTFLSTDEGIVTVEKGNFDVVKVIAVKVGTATIIVNYGGKTDTIEVTVNPVLLDHIVVLPETMTLFVGKSESITSITAYYNDGTDNLLDNWTYDLNPVGIVDVNDVTSEVTAIAEGETTITVSYEEDDITKTDTIEVTVKVPIVIDGILSPGEWDDYFWFTDNKGNECFGGIPEFTYYKTNDSDYLYFATIVVDPTPLEESNDDIWLAFRLDEGENYKVFRKGFTINSAEFGQLSETGAYGAYGSLPEGVEFGWGIDDSHVYYEWKIPLELLGVGPGETIKYLTHVREWSVEGLNYHPEVKPIFPSMYWPYADIEQFGDLTLEE